jgi:hypothetical protein
MGSRHHLGKDPGGEKRSDVPRVDQGSREERCGAGGSVPRPVAIFRQIGPNLPDWDSAALKNEHVRGGRDGNRSVDDEPDGDTVGRNQGQRLGGGDGVFS